MHNYQVLGLIGQGAYGVVLKAKNRITNKLVAIKKFKQNEDQDQIIKKIILRQIKVLKALSISNNHAFHVNKKHHIVELIEAFKKKGLYYLVFQYYDNNILQILEKSKQGLEKNLIAKYIFQLLQGLKFMHSKNFIHRDIKPQNLLVNSDHLVKICDMGFARNYNVNQRLTEYVATRWYRSPQLLFGIKYTFAIDIWAVGCLMAELIDGNPLFPGNDQIDQIKRIQQFFSVKIRKTGQKNKLLILEKKNHNSLFHANLHITKIDTSNLQNKYEHKIGEIGIDLLKRMLQLCPQKRITVSQCINHSFFNDIRQQYEQNQLQSLHKNNSEQDQIINNFCNHLKLEKASYTQSTNNTNQRKKQQLESIQEVNQNHIRNYQTNYPYQKKFDLLEKKSNCLEKKGQNKIHARNSSDFNGFSLTNWTMKFSKNKTKNGNEKNEIFFNNNLQDFKINDDKSKCNDLFENKTNRTQYNNSIKALLNIKNNRLTKDEENQNTKRRSYLNNFKTGKKIYPYIDKSISQNQKSLQLLAEKENILKCQQRKRSIKQRQSSRNLYYYRTSYDRASDQGSITTNKLLRNKIKQLKNNECIKSTNDQNINSNIHLMQINSLKSKDGLLKNQYYEITRNKNEVNLSYEHTNKIQQNLKNKYYAINQISSKSVLYNNQDLQNSKQTLSYKNLTNRLKKFKIKLGY